MLLQAVRLARVERSAAWRGGSEGVERGVRLLDVPEFLRTAKEMNLTAEDFDVLIEEVRRRRPSETVDTAET